MNLIRAYQTIKELETPVFNTGDIAAVIGISTKYAYKLLKQLSDEKLILHLRRGLWALSESIEPLMIPDYLTAPLPSYISLQTALYYHGLISQIPTVIYAISIARTRQFNTPFGIYSIHHINPELFLGFDIIGDKEIRMAVPEKALFDFFYLKSTKNKLFYALPEIEIPENFDWQKLKEYARLVGNKSRKMMILSEINRIS